MEQEIITEKHIDLQKILADKKVKAPRFVQRWLERLLHVEELNAGIYNNRDKFGLDFVHAFTEGKEPYNLGMEVRCRGLENVPLDGCPMVVGNHPLGGPDGLALMGAVGRKRQDILFPVTDFLLYLPGLRQLFVPIDKVNRSKTLANLEEAFAGQNILLYYPSGAASRRQKGVIKDLEWHPTFVKKAVKYHRDIVPVYTDARNRNIFYTVANIRKRLGIKFFFEMAMLPAEMFAQRGKTVSLTMGKAIPWQTFDRRHTPAEWAALLREHVYKLKDNPDAEFLG
ncbi:MAG: 1-acyl-sn-glycerol-3-phosphate acyltransferase [bacterium]